MYTIYSSKNKKLGVLLNDGSIQTDNKKLSTLYNTILNMGVFYYSIKRSKKKIEVVRKPAAQTDGETFLPAMVGHLDYMGFILKED